MIVTRVSTDGKTGVVVEVNCETDFVGRSDDFVAFAGAVAETIEQHKPADRGSSCCRLRRIRREERIAT